MWPSRPACSQIWARVIQGCRGPCLGALLCREEATSDRACSTRLAAIDVACTEPVGPKTKKQKQPCIKTHKSYQNALSSSCKAGKQKTIFSYAAESSRWPHLQERNEELKSVFCCSKKAEDLTLTTHQTVTLLHKWVKNKHHAKTIKLYLLAKNTQALSNLHELQLLSSLGFVFLVWVRGPAHLGETSEIKIKWLILSFKKGKEYCW